MTAREVFKACVGVNEAGEPRTHVKVTTSFMSHNDMSEEIKDELILDNAIVDIFQTDRLSMVSLKYDDPYDTEFLGLASTIRDFQTYSNSIDSEHSPIIMVAIMSKEAVGYYIMGVGGIGIVQPSVTGKENDTVTFIFTNDTIHPYVLDVDKAEKALEEMETVEE